MSVDLPLPVLPTIAVVSPGLGAERDVVQDRLLGARGSGTRRRGTRRRRAPGRRVRDDGCSGSWIDGSVSRTSRIRPADTAARGTRMNMKTAVSDREQDLGEVLEERGQVADRQRAVLDPDRAEPERRRRSTG